MAYSLVANTIAASSDALGVTTSAINTTGADLIVVVVGLSNSAGTYTAALSDSASNTWSVAVPETDGSGAGPNSGAIKMVYVRAPTTSSTHTFSWIWSGGPSADAPAIAVIAVSGSAPSPLDQTNSQSGSFQTGSVTPTTDNQLLVAGVS